MEHDHQSDRASRTSPRVVNPPDMEPRTNRFDEMKRASTITKFVLIRESDASDLLLLLGMATQTIQRHIREVPELELLLDDPIGPVADPSQRDVEVRLDRASRAVLKQIGEVLVIYYMGSAASRSEAGESRFGAYLAEMIERYQPNELRCGPFTRLGRSAKTFSTILEPIQKHRVKVISTENTLEPWTPSDEFLWSMFSGFAAQERGSIVTRTLLGRIAKAKRSGLANPAWSLPFGYHVVDNKVVPNAALRPVLREALMLMTDTSMPSRELVDRLGALGLKRLRPQIGKSDDSTVAGVIDAKDIRRRLVENLDLYETGITRLRISVALPGVDTLAGLPVIREPGSANGYVELDSDWGVPDDGWAEPWVFEAARAAQVHRDRGRKSSGRNRRPFTRTPPWRDGTFEYSLAPNDMSHYVIRRRTISSLPVEVGLATGVDAAERRAVESTEVVGRVGTTALAHAITESLTAALAEAGGIPATIAESHLPADVARSRALSITQRADHAAELRKRHDRARRRSVAEEDDEIANLLLADAAKFLQDARDIEAAIAREQQETTSTIRPPDVLELDVASLLAAFTLLSKTEGAIDSRVADAIQSVIRDLRVIPIEGTPAASVTFNLALPAHGHQVALFGPIQTTVPIRPRLLQSNARLGGVTTYQRVLDRLADGRTVADIVTELGYVSELRVESIIATRFAAAGVPVDLTRVAKASPVRELLTLVARCVRAELFPSLVNQTPSEIGKLFAERGLADEVITAEWAGWTLARYLNISSAHRSWAELNVTQQGAIDAVVAEGGSLDLNDLHLADPARYSPAIIGRLIFGHEAWPAILATSEPVVISPHLSRVTHGTLILRRCNHADCDGSLDVALGVHEVPGRLLCSTCRRSNDPGSPKFPDSYFSLAIRSKYCRDTPLPERSSPQRKRLLAITGQTTPVTIAKRRKLEEIPEGDRAQICEAYRNGERVIGPGSICERFGFSSNMLYRIIDAGGVPRRHTRIRKVLQSDDPVPQSPRGA